ncbi:hypothetical protein FJT64_016762 [Amphibalanus amphitrite]|uniref:Endonuclease/exonuclease/phosphatase domain-containing protein n=1 Tax=Amphibalanus amphitrite TaxID=1232801 RepID=A0A6A4WZR4_AMPAM|nr:hypothetical protein FJT64_016762 [Amphibalanus amphitrite]
MDSKFLLFPGYAVERCDRKSRAGGGICIIYRDTMQAEVLTVPSTGTQVESLWVRFLDGTIFVVGVLYRPPKSPIAPVLDDLNYQLITLLAKQHPVYILGDINIDLLQPSTPAARQYTAMLEDLSLRQLIDRPTRTTTSTSTH